MEEYVPTIIPVSNAKINPLMDSPPNKKMANKTSKVVNDVFNVLPNVLFMAPLNMTFLSPDLPILSHSRIRS